MTLSDSISSTGFSYAHEALKFGECLRVRASSAPLAANGSVDPIRSLTRSGVQFIDKSSSEALAHAGGPPVMLLAASAVETKLRSFELSLDASASSGAGVQQNSSYGRLQDYGAGQIAAAARLAQFENVYSALERWSALDDGWDDEDSPALARSSIGKASRFLFDVARYGASVPSPYISGDSEFGFEWSSGQKFASASFLASGDILLFVTDGTAAEPYRKRFVNEDTPVWSEFLTKLAAIG